MKVVLEDLVTKKSGDPLSEPVFNIIMKEFFYKTYIDSLTHFKNIAQYDMGKGCHVMRISM